MMSHTLRKRCREPDAPLDSVDAGEPKRFHREETDGFLHLLEVDKLLSEDDEEADCPPSEELLKGVIRSLEEEIAATCSSSYHNSSSADSLAANDIIGGHDSQSEGSDLRDDLCYLLEASDDELGIPSSPVLHLKDELCESFKATSDGFSKSMDLKFVCENWRFDDDFENYQQFSLYEDAWDACIQLQDYMNIECFSQGMLFDAAFAAGTGGM